ncbi:Peptidase M15 [compost metagenome]
MNSAVGSKPTSDHVQGYAADFVCPGYGDVTAVCHAIMDSTIQYDTLIHEFSSWIHLSSNPKMRRQNLTIDAQGARNGIA